MASNSVWVGENNAVSCLFDEPSTLLALPPDASKSRPRSCSQGTKVTSVHDSDWYEKATKEELAKELEEMRRKIKLSVSLAASRFESEHERRVELEKELQKQKQILESTRHRTEIVLLAKESTINLLRSKCTDLSSSLTDLSDQLKEVNKQREASRESSAGAAPKEFLCPITQDFMVDPVVCADGQSYERSAIEKWLETSNRSPLTNMELIHSDLYPNITLRSLISDYCTQNKIELPPIRSWSTPQTSPAKAADLPRGTRLNLETDDPFRVRPRAFSDPTARSGQQQQARRRTSKYCCIQ